MDEGIEFVPLALVIEILQRALHRANAAQASPQILRLSLHLPIFVEERDAVMFIRLPRLSDTRPVGPVTHLNASIGPSGEPRVIVESMR